jgi:hypothetical protein
MQNLSDMKQFVLLSANSSSSSRSARGFRRNRAGAEAADWNELLSLSESNEYRHLQPPQDNLGIRPLYRLDDLNRLNGVLYAKIA